MIVNNSMFQVDRSFSSITNMQERMAKLQVQLATQERAATLSELGQDISYDLTLRARQGRVAGYQNNIELVNLRLSLMDNSITRLDELEAEARATAIAGAGADNLGLVTAQTVASARLDEVLAVLNVDLNGRHLFGGSTTDQSPVGALSELLDGANGRDGFRTVAGERKLADAGADGRGRLVTNLPAADTVSLAEDGVHVFGLKLSTLSSDSSAITTTSPAGAPASLSVQFNAVPLAGETVTFGLTLPDGRSLTTQLTATTSATPGKGEFQVGASAAATATNLQNALNIELERIGNTELAAASVYEAADNFFAGQGETAMRVDGPPFETATALVAATDTDTVEWYRGEDSSGRARDTVKAQVDEATVVSYGVQANEKGIVDLVRSLAAMAVETYPDGDVHATDRFNAMAATQIERLAEANNSQAGSIEVIGLELGLASTTAGQAAERHTAYLGQIDTLLADIEQIPLEEVAMQLLSLQTRLEASYQTTSILSQLSLVNYIS